MRICKYIYVCSYSSCASIYIPVYLSIQMLILFIHVIQYNVAVVERKRFCGVPVYAYHICKIYNYICSYNSYTTIYIPVYLSMSMLIQFIHYNLHSCIYIYIYIYASTIHKEQCFLVCVGQWKRC